MRKIVEDQPTTCEAPKINFNNFSSNIDIEIRGISPEPVAQRNVPQSHQSSRPGRGCTGVIGWLLGLERYTMVHEMSRSPHRVDGAPRSHHLVRSIRESWILYNRQKW